MISIQSWLMTFNQTKPIFFMRKNKEFKEKLEELVTKSVNRF